MNIKLAGAIFKDRRKNKALRQEEVAKQAGVTASFVSSFEKGIYNDISVNRLEKLLKAIGENYTEFLSIVAEAEGALKKNLSPENRPLSFA